jgi:hypothetical protein
MDFLQRFSSEQGYRITQDLVGTLGFSTGQATSFLPKASRCVMGAFQGSKLDITELMGGGDPAPLLERIDVKALAGDVGIDEELAALGLAALVPKLLRSFRDGNGPDFGEPESVAIGH